MTSPITLFQQRRARSGCRSRGGAPSPCRRAHRTVPTAASSSASAANALSSCARSLGRRIDSANTASMSRSRTIGTAGSASRTAAATVCDNAVAGRLVRSATFIVGRGVGHPCAFSPFDGRSRLVEEDVELGSGLPIDAALLDVPGDANHRVPGVVARAHRGRQVRPQALPNRVAPLPEPVRQRFIDDDHSRQRRAVGPIEAAAGDDRDAQRREVVGHHELVVVDNAGRLARFGRRVLAPGGNPWTKRFIGRSDIAVAACTPGVARSVSSRR